MVFERIGSGNPDEYILIGDSLTSDMQGANNARIKNIWYNPKDKAHNLDVRVDYAISSLNAVPEIIEDINEL